MHGRERPQLGDRPLQRRLVREIPLGGGAQHVNLIGGDLAVGCRERAAPRPDSGLSSSPHLRQPQTIRDHVRAEQPSGTVKDIGQRDVRLLREPFDTAP